MPTNAVKTARDEALWSRAKAQAAKQGKAKNYALVMHIFQSMKGEKSMTALLAGGSDELRKAGTGEGSRGGQVIGHTAGGKPIYYSATTRDNHAHLDTDEHLEASAVHRKVRQQVYGQAERRYQQGGGERRGEIAENQVVAAMKPDEKVQFEHHARQEARHFFLSGGGGSPKRAATSRLVVESQAAPKQIKPSPLTRVEPGSPAAAAPALPEALLNRRVKTFDQGEPIARRHVAGLGLTSEQHREAAGRHKQQAQPYWDAKNYRLHSLHQTMAGAHAAAAGGDGVKKSEDAMNKAGTGEGSRGGVVIGHTGSGKPIYQSQGHAPYIEANRAARGERGELAQDEARAAVVHRKHEGWSAQDHTDAAATHMVRRAGAFGSAVNASMGHLHAAALVATGPQPPEHANTETNAIQKDAWRNKYYDNVQRATKQVNRMVASGTAGATAKSEDAMTKAGTGEGSRGGIVIGHTGSGKPIYAGQAAESYSGFTGVEHREAAAAHRAEASEAAAAARKHPTGERAGTQDWARFKLHEGAARGHDEAQRAYKPELTPQQRFANAPIPKQGPTVPSAEEALASGTERFVSSNLHDGRNIKIHSVGTKMGAPMRVRVDGHHVGDFTGGRKGALAGAFAHMGVPRPKWAKSEDAMDKTMMTTEKACPPETMVKAKVKDLARRVVNTEMKVNEAMQQLDDDTDKDALLREMRDVKKALPQPAQGRAGAGATPPKPLVQIPAQAAPSASPAPPPAVGGQPAQKPMGAGPPRPGQPVPGAQQPPGMPGKGAPPAAAANKAGPPAVAPPPGMQGPPPAAEGTHEHHRDQALSHLQAAQAHASAATSAKKVEEAQEHKNVVAQARQATQATVPPEIMQQAVGAVPGQQPGMPPGKPPQAPPGAPQQKPLAPAEVQKAAMHKSMIGMRGDLHEWLEQFEDTAFQQDALQCAKDSVVLAREMREFYDRDERERSAAYKGIEGKRKTLDARKDELELRMIEAKLAAKGSVEKGGEGSRGGKVIGHTSSGKPVYEGRKASQYQGFTEKDHRDAVNVHDDGKQNYLDHRAMAAKYRNAADSHMTAATQMSGLGKSTIHKNNLEIDLGAEAAVIDLLEKGAEVGGQAAGLRDDGRHRLHGLQRDNLRKAGGVAGGTVYQGEHAAMGSRGGDLREAVARTQEYGDTVELDGAGNRGQGGLDDWFKDAYSPLDTEQRVPLGMGPSATGWQKSEPTGLLVIEDSTPYHKAVFQGHPAEHQSAVRLAYQGNNRELPR